MTDTAKRVAWTFVQAFLGAFLPLASGILKAPNLSDARAAAVAAIIAGIAAGISALKNTALAGNHRLR